MTITHSEGELTLTIIASSYQPGYRPTREDEGMPEHFEEVRVWIKSPCGRFYDLEITSVLDAEALGNYGELALEALHEGKAERESRREEE